MDTCLLVATDATRRQMLASSFEMGIGKSFDCCAHSSMSPIGGGPNEIISMEELSDANDSASDLYVCVVCTGRDTVVFFCASPQAGRAL